jgi:5-methyltetrahydrofolate--homocysteine methyltransferase
LGESEILEKLRRAIIGGLPEDATELVNEALEVGIDSKRILDDAILKGAETVGLKYEEEEFFLADMLLAADAINACMNILKLKIDDGNLKTTGKVLIGTPEGDLHDIGKCLVIALLRGQGFEVVDLGVDVPPEKFLEVAKKENVDIIGLSGLLTMTISKMKETIIMLKQEEINAKIILGGGIMSEETCRQIGADAWTKDGWEGVKQIKQLLEERENAT